MKKPPNEPKSVAENGTYIRKAHPLERLPWLHLKKGSHWHWWGMATLPAIPTVFSHSFLHQNPVQFTISQWQWPAHTPQKTPMFPPTSRPSPVETCRQLSVTNATSSTMADTTRQASWTHRIRGPCSNDVLFLNGPIYISASENGIYLQFIKNFYGEMMMKVRGL